MRLKYVQVTKNSLALNDCAYSQPGHFSLNPGNDKDSFLLLGGGEHKRLTVENLRCVSLTGVELIVLSACNTATPVGKKTNGVEIESFGVAAQNQGAKAVLATL
jgi:CHAT domain-containing protein